MAIKTTTGGGSGGLLTEWIALSSAFTASSVAGEGARVSSVDTAWSLTGSRISAEVTLSAFAGDIRDCYTLAAPAAPLLAALGTSNSDIWDGRHSILVGIRQRAQAGNRSQGIVALCTSTGNTGATATLDGMGGGFRADASNADNVLATSASTTTSSVSGTSMGYADGGIITQIRCAGNQIEASASLSPNADDDIGTIVTASGGGATYDGSLWLVFSLGGALSGTATVDMDVHFALIAGANFADIPT